MTAKIVREIIRDLDGTQRTSFARRWIPIALGLALFILAIGFGWSNISELFYKTQTKSSPNQYETVQSKPPEVNVGTPLGTSTQQTSIEPNTQQTTSATNAQQPPPEESLQVKAQQTITTPEQETIQTKKTVIRGDTLTKLTNEIYGKSDNKTIGLVREKNPQITNPDIIHEGSTLIFPDLPK